jgi:RNA polymerase sigma factor (TIGR02999 family)
MSDTPASQITLVLEAIEKGDPQAADELLPLVYDELRRLARARLSLENPGQTLQPTALVHEAYLRVTAGTDPGWDSRGHFFAAAAIAMRRILVDQARRKARLKHAGAKNRVDLDDADVPIQPPTDKVLLVDEALERLEKKDPRKCQVVNLRYFAGLSEEETAAILGLSTRTVEREWRFAKSWLKRELDAGDAASGGAGEP